LRGELLIEKEVYNKKNRVIKKKNNLPNPKPIISGGPMMASTVASQMGIIDGGRNGNGLLATGINVAQIIGANLQVIRRKTILIN
jgi:hypothetical protein